MTTSVDGLISGMDTSSVINALLQAERQPQVRLQSKKVEAQKVVDVYQQLNTRLDALRSAAESLSSALDWRVAKISSSSEAVATATVATSAPSSVIAISVATLARAHAAASDPMTVDPSLDVVTTGPITIGATTITDVGTGSLNDIAAAINAAGAGVTATVVQTAPGTYRLHLAASSTGAASEFTVSGTLGSLGAFSVVTQASDASVTVGDGPGAYTVTSSTNSFTGLVSGATVSVHSLGSTTISVGANPDALADSVDKLVKAYNDAASYIRTNSTYDAASKKAGVLLSDGMTRRLAQNLNEALTDAIGGSATSAAGIGVEVDRYGVATFDRAAFLAAYEDDPAAVQAVFSTSSTAVTSDDGVAERLRLLADSATDSVSGAITNAISGRKSLIKDMETQITAWDERLSLREKALRTQFSNLETMLSKLRNQSTWLAGQVASLGSS